MSSKTYFDQVANQWEAMRRDFFSEKVREAAMRAAGVRSGQTAADIGAGTGFISRGLLDRGLRVIAVDQSEAMLQTLRGQLGDIDCRVGEAENLPVDDYAVDHVFANMYLHHVEAPAMAIREMARILKPGGSLVITDLDAHHFQFLKTEHHDRWLGFRRDDVRGWYLEAGLEGVRVDCVNQECCASSRDGSDSARITIFVASGSKG